MKSILIGLMAFSSLSCYAKAEYGTYHFNCYNDARYDFEGTPAVQISGILKGKAQDVEEVEISSDIVSINLPTGDRNNGSRVVKMFSNVHLSEARDIKVIIAGPKVDRFYRGTTYEGTIGVYGGSHSLQESVQTIDGKKKIVINANLQVLIKHFKTSRILDNTLDNVDDYNFYSPSDFNFIEAFNQSDVNYLKANLPTQLQINEDHMQGKYIRASGQESGIMCTIFREELSEY